MIFPTSFIKISIKDQGRNVCSGLKNKVVLIYLFRPKVDILSSKKKKKNNNKKTHRAAPGVTVSISRERFFYRLSHRCPFQESGKTVRLFQANS